MGTQPPTLDLPEPGRSSTQTPEAERPGAQTTDMDIYPSASDLQVATLQSQSKYNEANLILLEILGRRLNRLGLGHDHTLKTLKTIAVTFLLQGNWAVAMEFYSILLQNDGRSEYSRLAESTISLDNEKASNNILQIFGKNRADEVVLITEQHLRVKTFPLAGQKNSNAVNLQSQSQYDEANLLFLEALGTALNQLPHTHNHVTVVTENIAYTFQLQGNWKAAVEFYQVHWNRTRENPNEDNIDAAIKCSVLLQEHDQYENAKRLLEDVVKQAESTIGRNNPKTLNAQHHFGKMLRILGDRRAEGVLQNMVSYATDVLAPAELVECRLSLAIAFAYADKGKRALEEMTAILALSTEMSGSDALKTQEIKKWMALALRTQDKFEEAEAIYRSLLEWGQEASLNQDHDFILGVMHSLADTLLSKGKLEEASRLYQRALKGRQRILGQTNPDTLSSIHGLADVLSHQGKRDEAEKLYREVQFQREKGLGKCHYRTIWVMICLLRCLNISEETNTLVGDIRDRIEKAQSWADSRIINGLKQDLAEV